MQRKNKQASFHDKIIEVKKISGFFKKKLIALFVLTFGLQYARDKMVNYISSTFVTNLSKYRITFMSRPYSLILEIKLE